MFLTGNQAVDYDLPAMGGARGGAVAANHNGQAACLHGLFARQAQEQLTGGQSLFIEGEPADHVFEVAEGTLRVFRIISDGRRVITGFVAAGDIVGVSMHGSYIYSAEAIGLARVRRLPRRSFDASVNDCAALRPLLFKRVCEEMAAAQDQMVLLSSKNAEERLCTFLLKQLRRSADRGVPGAMVQLPMTRLDIADYLGLTIETVSRTITKLTNAGILCNNGRHMLQIIRPAALAQMAGDSDEMDHFPREQALARGRYRQ